MEEELGMPNVDTKDRLLGVAIGGPQKKRYYTPDGREVWQFPSIRGYAKKNQAGDIVEQGTRDANYDQGWLDSPPQNPKLYCKGCDKWHDTQEEVDACIKSKKVYLTKMQKRAQEELGEENLKEDNEIQELKSEVSELKSMLQQILDKEK